MHTTLALPTENEMYQAMLNSDAKYEGVFFTAVKTTGIFCRPTCPAKKPKRENVCFYRTTADALAAGFRPCLRCKPMHIAGATPDWLAPLLKLVEQDTSHRWTDADLREADVEPSRIRRWFKQHHGMTFHAYLRARRLSSALGQLQVGTQITSAAASNGYASLSGFREGLKKWLGEYPTHPKHIEPIVVNRILTPLGPMIAAASDTGLCLLEFADRRMLATQFKRIGKLFSQPIVPGEHRFISQAKQELDEYFAGDLTTFEVPLRADGTEFQMSVWKALLDIPHGQTTSYERLARSIDRPRAQRAVGRANGDNRFAILIPCHRVVRSDGTLCGYGGGLWRKRWLLEHERADG